MKYSSFFLFIILMITCSFNALSIDINPPKGRLAIVADGNSPDPDDITATPVTLAILKATGYNDRLVHYSHCCDLLRNQKISEQAERERHYLMQLSCDRTARMWGGFNSLTFFDAKWQMQQTVDDLKNAINLSTKDDPLWIIEAGEPDIIAMALQACNKDKVKYIKIITHHRANDDSGDFFTWKQVLDSGIEELRITDQNLNLKVPLDEWLWARDSKDPRIKMLWNFNAFMENDNVVKFQKNKFDCSDAGMLLYWLTGAKNGGRIDVKVEYLKSLFIEYINKNNTIKY